MRTRTAAGPVWAWAVLIVSLVVVVISAGHLLGLQLGSLPDWVEAVGTVGTLAMAVWVLRVEQRNRIDDERERQARQVGGYITKTPDGSPDITMTVTNSSPLAVRDVRGYVFDGKKPHATPWEFPDIPVLRSGEEQQVRLPMSSFAEWKLELEFDDDAGVRWRKYGDRPLREVK